MSALSFTHRYAAPSDRAETLLLLHGTGGDENDLFDLGEAILPGAGILSPRGKILERGMPRFFRRLAEGIFDMEDLVFRTHELADFIDEAAEAYGFDPSTVVAAGYSNGANIAASMLLLRPEALHSAILFHPMVPFVPDEMPDLKERHVFVGAGKTDPICPPEQAKHLTRILEEAGASVELFWQPGGHALTHAEVTRSAEWLTWLG